MKSQTIRYRFMIAVLLTTSAALVVSSVAMVGYNLRNYKERISQEANTQASLLARVVTPALQFNDVESAESFLGLLKTQPSINSAAVFTERGVLFAGYNVGDDVRANFISHMDKKSIDVDDNTLYVYRRIIENNEIIGFVFVGVHYAFYQKLIVNAVIALGVTFFSLVIAFLVSMRLQRSITDPLRSIIGLSKALVETKNYSLRAEKTTTGEIGDLIDAYNEMLDEVEQRKKMMEVYNVELETEIQERREAEQALKDSEEKIMQLNMHLEQRVRDRTQELEIANKELEAFSYSVSHDLRSPLRAIDGFSLALLEDYSDALDAEGQDCLSRVRQAAQRMGELIDDMLKLSRVTRTEMSFQEVDLSKLAEKILDEIKSEDSTRKADIFVTSGLRAECDPHLIKIALTNLFSNAWKYSSKKPFTKIEFGLRQYDGEPVFFVEDNGAGFDMVYVEKLFGAFQRLHSATDFPGSGIGLATVKRIISRHRGRIWAQSSPGEGTVFYFTLPPPETEIDQILDGEQESEYEANTASRG